MMSPSAYRPSKVLVLILLLTQQSVGQTLESRWGHAALYIPSPPSLLIQGGKTDPSSSFTYSSAPNSADTVLIALSDIFPGSSPPVRVLDTTPAPSTAFHTLCFSSGSQSDWNIFTFGGDGGPLTPTQTQPDSVWQGRLDIATGSVNWTQEPSGWGDQPQRRLYHSAAGPDDTGKVYITGGLKGDGSGATFADVYEFNPVEETFTPLPSLPQGIFGHSSVLLTNGTLVVLGGSTISPVTGNPETSPLDTVFIYDTTSAGAWTQGTLSGVKPEGRRGASFILSSDATKAMLFGGGEADLTTAYGDHWDLDLDTLAWRQVSGGNGGPSPRFGHTAVNVGSDQILIFGGYGDDGPADAIIHVWDGQGSTWATSLSPVVQTPIKSGGSESTGQPQQTATQAISGIIHEGQTQGGTVDRVPTPTKSQTANPSSTASERLASDEAGSGTMSNGAKIALILGALAIGSIIAAGLLYRYRRRKRRAALFGTDWNRGYPPRSFKEGSEEKGMRGLLSDGYNVHGHSKPDAGPLDFSSIAAAFVRVSSRLGRRPQPDPYAVICDESDIVSHPKRRSTRKIGSGIRLVDSRSAPRASYLTVDSDRSALSNKGESLQSHRQSRMNMLDDEDSRSFSGRVEQGDWAIGEGTESKRWSSARDILGEEEDPFNDGEDDSIWSPPLRGGPVPTPPASRSEFDPFGDNNRPGSSSLSAYDDLLVPPSKPFDDSSVPLSRLSGYSTTTDDAEEAVIHHAQLASPAPATISPIKTTSASVRRSDSFFKRMTNSSFTSLLNLSPSRKGKERMLDIRDPAPAPSLWPIESRDGCSSSRLVGYPPKPKKDDLEPPVIPHLYGPSLSSLQSAKSMRDMVIVQREPSVSSVGDLTIESAPSPTPSDTPSHCSKEPYTPSEAEAYGETSANGSDITHRDSSGHVTSSAVYGDPRYNTRSSDDRAKGRTRKCVSPDRSASKSILDIDWNPSALMQSALIVTPPRSHSNLPHDTASSRPVSTDRPKFTVPLSESPSGTPVPSPLLSHRRPVKDVVNSINKRSGGIPPAFASPRKSSKILENVPNQQKRAMTTYEAVKRERLLVTNPDNRRDVSRSNSG